MVDLEGVGVSWDDVGVGWDSVMDWEADTVSDAEVVWLTDMDMLIRDSVSEVGRDAVSVMS